MPEPNKKYKKLFFTTSEICKNSQPELSREAVVSVNTVQTMYPTKNHSPLCNEIETFDAGDGVESASEVFDRSNPSRLSLTTSDTEAGASSTDISELRNISGLTGNNQETKKIDKPSLLPIARTAPSPESSRLEDTFLCETDMPQPMNSCENIVCDKPPPGPNAHLKTLKKSFLPEMENTSILPSTSHRGQRPKSCGKSVTFDPHHKVISLSVHKSSSVTNLHLPNLEKQKMRTCHESIAPRMYKTNSDTERTTENKTKRCASSVIPIGKQANKRVSLSVENLAFPKLNCEKSKHIDQNLNKQTDPFSKAKLFQDLNERQSLETAIFPNFSNKEQHLKHDFGNTLDKDHDISPKPLLIDEGTKKQDRHHAEEEKTEIGDDCLISTSAQASRDTILKSTNASDERNSDEQSHEGDENSWGPNCPNASITNLAAQSGLRIQESPDCSEYSHNPVHLPGSIYDYYYRDEMSFSPHREPPQYPSASRRFSWRKNRQYVRPPKNARQQRVVLHPQRSVIIFQPPSETDKSSEAFGAYRAASQPRQRSPTYQTDLELKDYDFPFQHKLSSSSDLNREMKRVMRFHNCRDMPGAESETFEDENRSPPNVFFHNHGWFPRSTTAMRKTKYRHTVANIQRQWHDQWYREVNSRNVEKERKETRQDAAGVPPRPPDIPPTPPKVQSFEEGIAEYYDQSPDPPATTPCPTARTRSEVLSRTSDVEKADSDKIRPLSSDSLNWQSLSCSRAESKIHTEMKSRLSGETYKTQLRPTYSDGTSDAKSQNRRKKLKDERNVHGFEMIKSHQGYSGDFVQQAPIQEAGVDRSSSTEPGHDASFERYSNNPSKPSRGSSGTSSNDRYINILPDRESMGDALEPASTKVSNSKDDNTGAWEIGRNRGRARGSITSTYSCSAQRAPPLSWEIKHLDYMLLKAREDTKRTKL